MDYKDKVSDYLPEFTEALNKQLESDEVRWGDTWKNRPIEGQESRIQQDYADYFDKHFYGGKPINWLAICGNAMIAWIREQEIKKEIENHLSTGDNDE